MPEKPIKPRELAIYQSSMDGGLRFGADKMVCGWNVEHQRVGDSVGFAQHLINHHAIIADRRVNMGAGGGHISEAPAQAEADTANLGDGAVPGKAMADRLDDSFDIQHAFIGIILLKTYKTKKWLKVK